MRSHVVNNTRGYKIVGLSGAAETETFFWEKENRDITVKDYYETNYNIKLKLVNQHDSRSCTICFYSIDIQHCQR